MSMINYESIKPSAVHVRVDIEGNLRAWIWNADEKKEITLGEKQFQTKIIALAWYKYHYKHLLEWIKAGMPAEATF